MKKKTKIVISILIITCLMLTNIVYVNKNVIFQLGNPIPYISKVAFLNKDNSFIDVFDDETTYITKGNDYENLYSFIESKYDVAFDDQMGNAHIFRSEMVNVTLSNQVYWRYYHVWDVRIH